MKDKNVLGKKVPVNGRWQPSMHGADSWRAVETRPCIVKFQALLGRHPSPPDVTRVPAKTGPVGSPNVQLISVKSDFRFCLSSIASVHFIQSLRLGL